MAASLSLLRLAAPIVLMQLGLMLYGIVDTLFMGRIGPRALAGVALATGLYFSALIAAMGLLFSVDALSSRAFGAGRSRECAQILIHALLLALLCALGLFFFLDAAPWLYRTLRVEPEVAGAALDYLRTLRWAAFPMLLFAACRQYLQSIDVTLPQLGAVLAGNALNALLDYAWALGGLGCEALGPVGSARATVAAASLMALITLAAAARRWRACGAAWEGLRPELFERMLRLGLPASLQTAAEVGVFGLQTILCGRFGVLQTAAHQITLNLASATFMVPLGISFAAAVRVGQALGHREPRKAASAGAAALRLAWGFMGAAALLFLLLPKALLGCYTSDPDILALGEKLLAIAAFFQVFDGTQVVLTGALRGLGETRLPMWANIAGHWGLGLPISLYFGLHLGWGALGIWLGLCAGLVAVAVALFVAWRLRERALLAGSLPAAT